MYACVCAVPMPSIIQMATLFAPSGHHRKGLFQNMYRMLRILPFSKSWGTGKASPKLESPASKGGGSVVVGCGGAVGRTCQKCGGSLAGRGCRHWLFYGLRLFLCFTCPAITGLRVEGNGEGEEGWIPVSNLVEVHVACYSRRDEALLCRNEPSSKI